MRKSILAFLLVLLVSACGPNKCDKPTYVELTQSKLEEFEDALDVAGRTPRNALSGPVADLQRIRRETADLEIDPGCPELLKVHDYLVRGMDEGIQGLLSFMSQESEAVVDSHFTAAANLFGSYNDLAIEWILEGQ